MIRKLFRLVYLIMNFLIARIGNYFFRLINNNSSSGSDDVKNCSDDINTIYEALVLIPDI